MIYPKPYTIGGGIKTSPILGVSSTYSIDEASIISNLGSNLATYLSNTKKDFINCFFQSIFSPIVSSGYQYVLIPNSVPSWPVMAWWCDRDDTAPEDRLSMFPDESSRGELLWVKDDAFSFGGKIHTLYKIKCFTTGSSEPTPTSLLISDVRVSKLQTTIIS